MSNDEENAVAHAAASVFVNDEKDLETQIDYLQKWFEDNKNLPKQVDRIVLKRFYFCMFRDLDATKKLIKINYKIRNENSHIFIKRDPIDEDSQKTFDYVDMVPIPGLTPDKCKVTCVRFCDADPKKVNHTEDTKAFIMITDCRFSLNDSDNENQVSGQLPNAEEDMFSQGEIQIFDMDGLTMKHVTRLSISTLRVYMKFLQVAFPVRIKGIHMINCPSYLDKLVSVVRPLISKEIFNMMKFHTNGIETLYEYVPKSHLPHEYGGMAGNISDLKAQFLDIMKEKRDYLMDKNYWKIRKT